MGEKQTEEIRLGRSLQQHHTSWHWHGSAMLMQEKSTFDEQSV